ncbi:riboflavin-specific deaminase-like protein [Krasilnikovia cinnamomea]|uniref:Riboflavin-specific deaminase-like protein n=1 Tax=Krasilnikovia cinnamomea TaxID=349313 RepID=A0A4Q7ZH97_9ACTN|nr:pyrimidine reductase family protein [Krasilnikovia cinnamomea]RZU49545.1 riboflavin-specific deaminase-like protein [Krasilnikovia cinnamomea]
MTEPSVRAWPDPDPTPLDVAALTERYPRNPEPTLRVNFVASLDGAVAVDGFSAGLSGPADKLIFGTLRMLCDALVVAAGTIRTENYNALRLSPTRREWRRAHGLPEFPLMVVVSRMLDLDPAQEVFSDAPVRPIILTCAAAPEQRRAALDPVAELVTVGQREVDLAAGLAALHARGATQVLCEGGPVLFGALTAADLVDELCLTVSPLLVGGTVGRIAAGPPGPPRAMSLRGILSADDMLFLRYARSSRPSIPPA